MLTDVLSRTVWKLSQLYIYIYIIVQILDEKLSVCVFKPPLWGSGGNVHCSLGSLESL